jgi:hypothetical protein
MFWSCCHFSEAHSRVSDLQLDSIVRSSWGKLPRVPRSCHSSCSYITTRLRLSPNSEMIAVNTSLTAFSRHQTSLFVIKMLQHSSHSQYVLYMRWSWYNCIKMYERCYYLKEQLTDLTCHCDLNRLTFVIICLYICHLRNSKLYRMNVRLMLLSAKYWPSSDVQWLNIFTQAQSYCLFSGKGLHSVHYVGLSGSPCYLLIRLLNPAGDTPHIMYKVAGLATWCSKIRTANDYTRCHMSISNDYTALRMHLAWFTKHVRQLLIRCTNITSEHCTLSVMCQMPCAACRELSVL